MQVLTSRVLRSIVVDYLKHSIEQEDVAIIYIYCSYKEKGDQTAANLVASLLQQLAQKSTVISGEILSLYDHHTKNGTRLCKLLLRGEPLTKAQQLNFPKMASSRNRTSVSPC